MELRRSSHGVAAIAAQPFTRRSRDRIAEFATEALSQCTKTNNAKQLTTARTDSAFNEPSRRDKATVANWIAAIAAVLAALVALVALGVSLRAKEIAESANVLGQTANNIAGRANELSGDANTIAERALRVAQDDVPYNWLLEVGDDGVAVVLNDCGHPALQATVVLDSGRQFVAEAGPVDIVPFGKIALDAKSAIEEHFEIVRSHPAEYPHRQGPVMFSGGPGSAVSVEFRAHLRWRTEQDIPRNDVVEVVLRHQMTYDGLQRIENRDE